MRILAILKLVLMSAAAQAHQTLLPHSHPHPNVEPMSGFVVDLTILGLAFLAMWLLASYVQANRKSGPKGGVR